MSLKLFVKIDNEYKELSAVAVGLNVKDIQKREISYCVNYYLEHVTSQKCVKNQKNEASFFRKIEEQFRVKNLLTIDQVESRHIEEIETLLLKTMKPSSLNRRFNVLRNFFNKCDEWQFLHSNPFKKIKPKKTVENHFKVWSQIEFESFIKLTGGSWRNMILFLYLTGCRPVEARNLRWIDVDYDNKIITLQCGKNQGGTREIQITRSVDELLHSMTADSLNVFSMNKKNIEDQNLYHYVKHRLNRLGFKHLTIYGLRHTFASALNNTGANAFTIKELMGHSQIKTTLKYITNSGNNLIESLERARR